MAGRDVRLPPGDQRLFCGRRPAVAAPEVRRRTGRADGALRGRPAGGRVGPRRFGRRGAVRQRPDPGDEARRAPARRASFALSALHRHADGPGDGRSADRRCGGQDGLQPLGCPQVRPFGARRRTSQGLRRDGDGALARDALRAEGAGHPRVSGERAALGEELPEAQKAGPVLARRPLLLRAHPRALRRGPGALPGPGRPRGEARRDGRLQGGRADEPEVRGRLIPLGVPAAGGRTPVRGRQHARGRGRHRDYRLPQASAQPSGRPPGDRAAPSRARPVRRRRGTALPGAPRGPALPAPRRLGYCRGRPHRPAL